MSGKNRKAKKRREYHKKWSLISWLVKAKRAKWRCERCNAQHGEPHPITGSKVILSTAHLDQNTSNNCFSNLAALCRRCHFKHDKGMNQQKRKYGWNYLEFQYVIDFPNVKIFYNHLRNYSNS